MSFHDQDHHFSHQVTPDTGASKTIFAKNIIDGQRIKISPKPDSLELYTAAGEPMTHCKYFGGTHYCGCLCYVSSSSLRVLRAANDSALPMAVPNPKYSHKK